ncbi:pentapeptide repeat-containing protein [Nitrospira sp. Kam-Ns4a]
MVISLRPGCSRVPRLAVGCVLAVLALFLWSRPAAGTCVLEPVPPRGTGALTRYLGKDCTDQERAAQAVSASDVLAALRDGKGVDLRGVVVTGDLLLDQLQPIAATDLGVVPSLRLRERLQRERLEEVRVINGPIAIRDSVIRGLVTTNLRRGLLIVNGPVVMTGTTFERPLDLSFTAFLGPVDFSEAVFLGEGFFIQALFDQPVRFEKTAFGIHSRFHRSRFAETATFTRAGFNGLAEFLEVTFDKDAGFSRAYFKMGAGFSGSRFRGILDFSEALFEREAFFLFTVFEQDAYFRRTTFRGRADFSDAQFQALDDFSKVMFEVEPSFARTKVSQVPTTPRGLQDPRVFYAIAATLFAFTVVLLLFMRRQ